MQQARSSVLVGFVMVVALGCELPADGDYEFTADDPAMAQLLGEVAFASDDRRRAAAMNGLLSLGDAAVTPIAARLNAPNTTIQAQWSYALLLGQSDSAHAVEPLLANLRTTENAFQRSVIKTAFKKLGAPAIRPLMAYLEARVANAGQLHNEWLAVAAVCGSMGHLGHREAAPHIRTLLSAYFQRTANDNGSWGADEGIKTSMMRALVRLADRDSRALFQRIANTDPDVGGSAPDLIRRLDLSIAGKHPFSFHQPTTPLDPKRVYSTTWSGGSVYHTDRESGQRIDTVLVPEGSPTR